MTDRERGFLDAVLADPSDDFVRLVYADWLEENDQAERAEFIRVQIELARCSQWKDNADHGGPRHQMYLSFMKLDCRWCSLERRERELLGARWHDWLSEGGMSHYFAMNRSKDGYGWVIKPSGEDGRLIRAEFRRGFVGSLSLTLADFMTHAGAIFAAAPVEEVAITDRHPGHDARGYQGWWGTDDLVVGGDNIPLRLHAFLPPSPFWQRGHEDKWAWYHSEAEAIAALSLACVAYGRDKAGLPTLSTKEVVSR
jgi:uncharacterized protein (TIGR02996 family)